ncbi:condensation domain-containing protein [Ruminococcus flavefaciens]|uniref:condensation domain-containing protein n=1 Tax=Ruminococcus flavefaciens TaxID=1265 RepID=UPI000465839E|nr:condensation domain-containing protein [Ruminococcus flavefaciens]
MAKVNKNIENVYPLSPLQEGMLFHYLSDRNTTAYILQSLYNIKENFDTEKIKQALALLSQRFSVLRTMFVYEKMKDIYQIVLKERELGYEYIDLSDRSEAYAENVIKEVVEADLNKGFDLKKDPLFRITHVKVGEKKDKMLLSYHHIIVDGWCNTIMLEKLFEYYESLCSGRSFDDLLGAVNEEKASSSDYSDYIKWLIKQDKNKAREFWRELLDGYDSDCSIKPAFKAEKNDENVCNTTHMISRETTALLKNIAESNQCTINSAAEAAVGILLQTYSHSDDVVFGKVISGRNAPVYGIEKIVGLFINTIPVRVTTDASATVVSLMRSQQEQSINSTNYDYFSLAEIQSMTSQGSGLINILYVFENYMSGDIQGKEEKNIIDVESERDQTNYPISILAFENDGRLGFKIIYDSDIFCRREIENILSRIEKICEEMASHPDSRISELEVVTDSEKQLILGKFNATETNYQRDKTVVELFEEQVNRTPNNTALVFENNTLTYAELNAKANSLAHKLRELGVKPDDFVAIIADRSIEMICGIYGIIKSGGAYVPIDPTYPAERISFMLDDCKPKAVLKYTTENVIIDNEIPVIDLTDSKVWTGAPNDLQHINTPNDLIYCIYTSGTTGKPKGVMIEHHGVVAMQDYLVKLYNVTEKDNVLQFANYIFDASVWEMTLALYCGAALVLISSEKIADTIEFENYIKEKKCDFDTSAAAVFPSD